MLDKTRLQTFDSKEDNITLLDKTRLQTFDSKEDNITLLDKTRLQTFDSKEDNITLLDKKGCKNRSILHRRYRDVINLVEDQD